MPIDVPRSNPAVAALALTDEQAPLSVQDYKLRQYEREKLDYNREELTRKRITGGQQFDNDQRVRAAVQQWGHDPERLEQEFNRIDPMYGAEFRKRWQDSRAATIKADIEETKLHKEEGDLGIALLQGIGDEDSYQIALPAIRQRLPELGATLPDHYDPEKVSTALQYGMDRKQMADMRLDMHKFIASGQQYQGAAIALGNPATDTQQEWDDAIVALKGMGIPDSVLRVFGDFDGGEGPKRAINLGMTIKDRKTLEETNRGNLVDEAERERENRAQATETQRTHMAGEATDRTKAAAVGAGKAGEAEDPNVSAFADQYMAGHTEGLMGKTPSFVEKVEGLVLRRGGQLSQKRVKLPAALQNAVIDAEQGSNALDIMIPLMKDEWVGPAAGRWKEFYTSLPGTDERSKEYAQFLAATADLTNRTIRAITGAAVGVEEEKRIKAQIPTPDQKPAQWRANAAATKANLAYLSRRALQYGGATPEMIEAYQAERTAGSTPPAGPAAGDGTIVTLPDGRKKQFPSKAAADAYKQKVGL